MDPDITFLNHGSYGACPIPVFEDYQKWQKTLENQPVQFMTDYLWKYLKRSRECLGDFIKCSEEDIILSQRGDYVELFINNEYKGIYSLNEQIDVWT